MGKIKDMPFLERPYEKLMMYGEKGLTNSELLSIIIKTGTKEKTSIEIAQKLINTNAINTGDLRFLQDISIKELMCVEGIGKVKAIELKAVGEIAKRISKPINQHKIHIQTREDIANLFMEELRYERYEIIKLMMLNNKNIVQKIMDIAIGNDSGIVFDIKQILSEPVKMQTPRIVVIHNHPSGNPEPSKMDIEFTRNLKQASMLMGIELLDHIIIGDGIYKSVI